MRTWVLVMRPEVKVAIVSSVNGMEFNTTSRVCGEFLEMDWRVLRRCFRWYLIDWSGIIAVWRSGRAL